MYNFINDFKEIRRDNLYHISNDIWGTIIHKLNNNRTSNNDLIDSILHSSSDEIDTDFSGSGSESGSESQYGSECKSDSESESECVSERESEHERESESESENE